MDEKKDFQSKEADKLANWVAQTLALKEAKVHANDGLAAVGQRASVSVEVHEMPDTSMPPTSTAESQSGINNGGGLTEEQVREPVEEMLEDYATKEWVEQKLEDYATKEWVEDKGYATEEWVEDKGYATEEWVMGELEPYAQKDWVEDKLSNYVRKDEFSDLWWEVANDGDGIIQHIVESSQFGNAVELAITEFLRGLGVEASCQNGSVTVTLTGIP